VVCQRLRYFPERNLRAPECEVLVASQPVKAMIRQSQFFKLQTALETGAADGSFTFQRYREWLDRRTDWYVPSAEAPSREPREIEPRDLVEAARAPRPAGRTPVRRTSSVPSVPRDGVLEIPSSDEDLGRILDELERGGE
jgi:twitching motility protein PilT